MSRKAALDALAEKKRNKREKQFEDEDDSSHYDEFGNLLPCFTDDFIEDDMDNTESSKNLPPDVEEEEVVDSGEINLPAAKRAKLTVQTTLNNSWSNTQTNKSPVSPQDLWRSLNKSSTPKQTYNTHPVTHQNNNNNRSKQPFNVAAIPKPLIRHPVAITNSPSLYDKHTSPPTTQKPQPTNKVNLQQQVSPPPKPPQTFSFVQVPSKSTSNTPKSPPPVPDKSTMPPVKASMSTALTPEQLERIERNRRAALERLQQKQVMHT